MNVRISTFYNKEDFDKAIPDMEFGWRLYSGNFQEVGSIYGIQ